MTKHTKLTSTTRSSTTCMFTTSKGERHETRSTRVMIIMIGSSKDQFQEIHNHVNETRKYQHAE